MRASRLLSIGMALSVLVGAVTYAAAGSDDSSSPASVALIVPFGHVGDRVAYAMFTENGDTRTPIGQISFQVNSTATMLDEFATPRASAEILWDVPPATSTTAIGGAYYWRESHGMVRTFLDLAMMDMVRHDYLVEDLDLGDSTLYTEFGPSLREALFRDWYQGSADPVFLVRSQGRAYTPGQDLSDIVLPRFANEMGLPNHGTLYSFSARVGDAAVLQGNTVLPIRWEGSLRFSPTPPAGTLASAAFAADAAGLPLLSFLVPRDVLVSFSRVIWVSASSPYPLLVEDEVTLAGGKARNLWSLAAEERGAVPILWFQAEDPRVPGAEQLERTSGLQHYPGDGAHTTVPSLQAAVEWAHSSPRAASFQAWKLAHPDVELLGADLWGDGYGLLFGSTNGDAFEIYSGDSTKDLNTPPSGELKRVVTYSPDGLPINLVTLGAVEGLGRSLLPTTGGWLVDSAWWGIGFHSLMPNAVSMVEGHETPLTTWGGIDATRNMSIAFYQEALGNASWLWLNIRADTGELLHMVDMTWIVRDYGPGDVMVVAENLKRVRTPEPTSHEAVATSSGATRAAWAAFATASILGVLLAAYLYPLIRFAASGAAGVFGYAKLRKPELLNHRLRDELVHQIRADPGVSPPELARLTKAPFSTIAYHLRVLEKNGLLSSLIDGRHKRFFPTDSIDFGRRGQLAALRNPKAQAIMGLINNQPGVRLHQLSKRTGLTMPGMQWHIRRLEAAGLVGHAREGRRLHFFSTSAVGSSPAHSVSIEVA